MKLAENWFRFLLKFNTIMITLFYTTLQILNYIQNIRPTENTTSSSFLTSATLKTYYNKIKINGWLPYINNYSSFSWLYWSNIEKELIWLLTTNSSPSIEPQNFSTTFQPRKMENEKHWPQNIWFGGSQNIYNP